RYFASEKRKYIVADTPGHEQYTRNMVTGASTADVAVLLVDARKGVLTQTRRHSYLAKLVGIRRFVLAVNKMDLVDYDEAAFDAITADYRAFAERTEIEEWVAIPVSGLNGDNVVGPSAAMRWYNGPSVLQQLDSVPLDAAADAEKPLRMPVQWVNRPNQDFRGFAGQIASGKVASGDEIRILPSGRLTRIERVVTADGDLDQALAGQSVTLTFADEVDCSRGDVIAAAGDPPEVADQFEASIVWMDEHELIPGRGYWLKLSTQTVGATVQHPKYEVNVNTLEHLAAPTLGFTETDRIENIRRVGEFARLMVDAGLIVLTAFISPFRAEREMVRKMMPDGEFIEIFVDTPLIEAEKRDAKGLYAKARAGELK